MIHFNNYGDALHTKHKYTTVVNYDESVAQDSVSARFKSLRYNRKRYSGDFTQTTPNHFFHIGTGT